MQIENIKCFASTYNSTIQNFGLFSMIIKLRIYFYSKTNGQKNHLYLINILKGNLKCDDNQCLPFFNPTMCVKK